jgi:hypothetical protein
VKSVREKVIFNVSVMIVGIATHSIVQGVVKNVRNATDQEKLKFLK